jgi:flavin-dependent dehydrogenase
VILIKVDIVGGSIAGLSSALSIKENNESIDVVVHEKNKKIGYNHEGRKCGEAHSIEKE